MPGTMRIVHDASSTSTVRRRLAADLRVQGIPADVVDDATLLVSELVGNAVRYGRPLRTGDLQVHWDNDTEHVLVAVSDGGGPSVVRPRQVGSDATSGRGLAIVDAIADDWGVRRDDSGCTVWARLQPVHADRTELRRGA